VQKSGWRTRLPGSSGSEPGLAAKQMETFRSDRVLGEDTGTVASAAAGDALTG